MFGDFRAEMSPLMGDLSVKRWNIPHLKWWYEYNF